MPFNLIKKDEIVRREKRLVDYWREHRIFERSVEERPTDKRWILYDGPPFATGKPHHGHLIAGALKDVYPRFHTMLGKRVERRFGWDCHGVPVEYIIEKELNLEGRDDILKMGIAKYNEACRSIVMKYTKEWRQFVSRKGRFVQMKNDYKTMDPLYMQSVWAVFKRIFDKKLVYKGKKVVAFSPGLGTPLSDFEASQNYQKTQDPSLIISFPLLDEPDVHLLVWTTTPWTVPTNVAIAINPNIEYVQVTRNHQQFIIAKSLANSLFTETEITAAVVRPIDSLLGKRYEPMFNISSEITDNEYRLISSKHVTADTGTGLVHISPAFGEDDYKLGLRDHLPARDFMNVNGFFEVGLPIIEGTNVPDIQGLYFKDADKPLIAYMKEKQRVFKHTAEHHNYPFCWRTNRPLIYRAVPTWFIKVTEIKDRVSANNAKVRWYPDFVGTKRQANWLENARDWAVSRDRFWGCPIPIWENVDDPDDVIVIDTIAELKILTGDRKITDLHRHHIDNLTVEKDGKQYKRISQVFDCWFESGSMPYAQPYGDKHFPFDIDDETFKQTAFPADFIAEGIDQTRGWFYTLLVIGTILFDEPPFKNCVVNGILLGNDGKKMSKSKGNFTPIDDVFENYGADAIRLVLLSSRATQAQSLSVQDSHLKSVIQEIHIPVLNIYRYFADCANDSQFHQKGLKENQTLSVLNQWMMVEIETFRASVFDALENYNTVAAYATMKQFVDKFSSWYVRNIKRDFIGDDKKLQNQNLEILYHALNIFAHCIAPMAPFLADILYLNLVQVPGQSVHLNLWPKPQLIENYQAAHDRIDLVRQIVKLAYRIREKLGINLRQPLASLTLPTSVHQKLVEVDLVLIQKEANVKTILCINSEEIFTEEVSLNARILAPRLKQAWQDCFDAVRQGDYIIQGGKLHVLGQVIEQFENETTLFEVKKVPTEKFQNAECKGELWVFLDKTITPELKEEGDCRTLLRLIQRLRQKAKLTKQQEAEVYIVKNTLDSWLQKQIVSIRDMTNSTLNMIEDFPEDDFETIEAELCGVQIIMAVKRANTQTNYARFAFDTHASVAALQLVEREINDKRSRFHSHV